MLKILRLNALLPTNSFLFYTLLCISFLILAACSSGNGDSANTIDSDSSGDVYGESELLISLTDAEGDFLSYLVNVNSITLHKTTGEVIEALPISTSVDFAQYVEATELLNITTVPAGLYDSAEITLDFTNAQIIVQNENGDSVTASAIDADGNPLTVVSVAIEFGDRDKFVIRRGIPVQVTLDFDLDASNQIVIDNDAATVIVNPVFVADTILEHPKSFRLRGLLAQVSQGDDVFTMDLRPFRRRVGHYGSARIHVNAQTRYEINQQPVANEEGLIALQALEGNNAVVTEGVWNRITHRYIANYVYAGSSVPWYQADMLRGTVVKRTEDVITVRGAVIEMADGQFVFNDTVTVTLSDSTRVLIRAALEQRDATIADISVGSAVFISGDVESEGVMDASNGYVGIHLSHLSANIVNSGPLALDLDLINGRRVDLFDFTGTGIDAANDADPDNYEIDTGSLSLSGLLPGDPVHVRGLIKQYGSAPEDFIATTIINAAEVRAHLVISYGSEGSVTAISNIDESGILFNLEDAVNRHHIYTAGTCTDLNDLPAIPLIAPGDERGIYAITKYQRVKIYTYYSDFLAALNEDLEAGELVSRFDAHGFYDSDNALFTSLQFRVRLVSID